MSFDWLKKLHRDTSKPTNYAEKTLAAYRLGMRANGSIVGVRIEADPGGCPACRLIGPNVIYHPDNAPHLPLADCDRRDECGCVYRPVMNYEVDKRS